MARNIGDARSWEKVPNVPDRRDFTTRKGMVAHVFPGDIDPPADKEGQDFDYFWWYMKYEDEFDFRLEDGWALAKTSDGWKPNRWRTNAENLIIWAGHALMFRPADIRREEEAEKAKVDTFSAGMADAERDLHQMADQAGVGTYRIDKGKRQDIIKPRNK